MVNDYLGYAVNLLQQRSESKGVILVKVAVLMIIILGCTALAVDMGHLYVARTELQRAADAAALASVQALGRNINNPFGDYALSEQEVRLEAARYAGLNTCVGKSVLVNSTEDVKIGYLHDPTDLNTFLQILPLAQCNAVQVAARRSTERQDGGVSLFFAPIWGITSSSVGASATAVLDDRFSAYVPQTVGGVPVIPFGVDAGFWDDQVVASNGPDDYSFDASSDTVSNQADGLPEIQLFPEKLSSSTDGSSDGSGNFTLLHIGSGSLGTSTINNQITNGVSASDFTDMTGEPMIEFYDTLAGESTTYEAISYDVQGDPGIKAGLKAAMNEKIGQIVGFFIYDQVVDSGANAVFTVTDIRFGRVMESNLVGNDKAIVIQPVAYYGPDIQVSPAAPSTRMLVGRVQLVR